MIVVAGGALTLAPEDSDAAFLLKQIGLAIRLHQANRVLLMSHSDCATDGGLAAFEGDHEREITQHRAQLLRSAAVVKQHFPEVTVERLFVTFAGINSFDDEEA
jgi:hypothetical protein